MNSVSFLARIMSQRRNRRATSPILVSVSLYSSLLSRALSVIVSRAILDTWRSSAGARDCNRLLSLVGGMMFLEGFPLVGAACIWPPGWRIVSCHYLLQNVGVLNCGGCDVRGLCATLHGGGLCGIPFPATKALVSWALGSRGTRYAGGLSDIHCLSRWSCNRAINRPNY